MTIIRIYSPISLADIESVISGLEIATGGSPKIHITETFDLEVTDERHRRAIEALFDTGNGKPADMPPKFNAKHKAGANTNAGGAYPYTITATGEKLSGRMLHKRIKSGEIQPGTKLKSHKGHKFVVNAEESISPA